VASQRFSDARTRDLWLHDLERNSSSRFTFEPGEEAVPVWSPDGRTIFYSGEGKNDRAIYRKSLDGTDPVLVSDNEGVDDYPMAVSFDGRYLAAVSDGRKTSLDIWLIPLQGGGKARPLLQTLATEIAGGFSPDGRWFSYSSNESGSMQVYVTSFPDPGRKWQISKDSGIYPIWSRDGRKILYQTEGGQLRLIGIDASGESVRVGSEKVLFESRPASPGFRSYTADADLRRFVRMRFDTKAEPMLHVVLNWPQTLRPSEPR
jgi:Tol biopolymer transport system component